MRRERGRERVIKRWMNGLKWMVDGLVTGRVDGWMHTWMNTWIYGWIE